MASDRLTSFYHEIILLVCFPCNQKNGNNENRRYLLILAFARGEQA